jgi:hypothetical protein
MVAAADNTAFPLVNHRQSTNRMVLKYDSKKLNEDALDAGNGE